MHNYEIQVQTARQHDQHSFAEILHQTGRNENTMLSALGVKERGNGKYAMADLAAAFTKVVL
jgi:hypothetical protein